MEYADTELADADEDRYSDRLSPPIFLAITLGLVHGLELAIGQGEQDSDFLADDRNLLAFRMIAFSVFPLVLSVRLLRRRGEILDRKILKPLFYSQCYVAAPYAAFVSSAPFFMVHLPFAPKGKVAALFGSLLLATIWYLVLQARWVADQLDVTKRRGFGHALLSFVIALTLVVVLSSIIDTL